MYANFGRSPIVAIVPDVGEWFDRRDRSLVGWPAALAGSNVLPTRIWSRTDATERKIPTNKKKQKRFRSLARTSVQGPTSASERTDWFQRSRDFCLPLPSPEYIVAFLPFGPVLATIFLTEA